MSTWRAAWTALTDCAKIVTVYDRLHIFGYCSTIRRFRQQFCDTLTHTCPHLVTSHRVADAGRFAVFFSRK